VADIQANGQCCMLQCHINCWNYRVIFILLQSHEKRHTFPFKAGPELEF